MRRAADAARLRTEGKFFQLGERRVFLRGVSYGPFPGGWPADCTADFRRIASAGLDHVRLYSLPTRGLLDAAFAARLHVFAGLGWGQHADFIGQPGLLTEARVSLVEWLRECARHPALAGVLVANEIPPHLARWMGVVRTREAIESLIDCGKQHAPDLLYAYANFPSTEYLEPRNADFSAFNVYLESPAPFVDYLARLHHIAGDRPLLVSEFGLCSRHHGLLAQARAHEWATTLAHDGAAAGLTHYAWSDLWFNRGQLIADWDFGLTDRDRKPKPALNAVAAWQPAPSPSGPSISIIICTRNGRSRIDACLEACVAVDGADEILVVDDGSEDGTADHVSSGWPEVRLMRLCHGGLSVARNAGAAAARSEVLAYTDDDCLPDREWAKRLRRAFRDGTYAAVGGPNLPPPPRGWRDAVIRLAPGAATHVMLDDTRAEHLPGCNLAVRKSAFEQIGGFDPVFRTAGDDVDFCWRLREAGHVLGFAPGAFVWHDRRDSLRGYLRQQAGYGHAERLLRRKHPERFAPDGGAMWQGCVYTGAAAHANRGDVIYYGPMAMAGYQFVVDGNPDSAELLQPYDTWRAWISLRLLRWLAPRLRAWKRSGLRGLMRVGADSAPPDVACAEPLREIVLEGVARECVIDRMLADGWLPESPTSQWDLSKGNTRALLATVISGDHQPHTLVRIIGSADREFRYGTMVTRSPACVSE